jgi:PhnB protein
VRIIVSDQRTPRETHTYLNYGGNCAEAFGFHEEHLGGKIVMMAFYGQQSNGAAVPDDLNGTVLHARLHLGENILMGTDVPPTRFQPMHSAYLTLLIDSIEQTERVYGLLAEGGGIFMPMAETFFAFCFAMLRDRFGTSWMLLNEKPMPRS